jgi:hypothetical protein
MRRSAIGSAGFLDLGAFVELGTAEHAVRQRRTDEDLLERSRLRVGAIEDRDVTVLDATLRVQFGDLVGDELRLVVLAIAGEPDDLVAVAHGREELLVLAVEVVRNHRVRRAQDVLRRSVILLEQHDLGIREVPLELHDVADVRAAERVDGLVGVADNGERCRLEALRRVAERGPVEPRRIEKEVGARGLCELSDEGVLSVVGVLVLVDQNVPEAPLVERRHLREGPEEVDGLADEVVEVEGVRARETPRVLTEDIEEDPLLGVVEVRPAGVGLHVAQLVLELGDLAGDPAHREAEGVGIQVLDDPLDEGTRVGRVVDREVLAESEVLGLAAEYADAGGVEGGDPHALCRLTEDRLDALAHLCRGLVGEGDREDLRGPGLP